MNIKKLLQYFVLLFLSTSFSQLHSEDLRKNYKKQILDADQALAECNQIVAKAQFRDYDTMFFRYYYLENGIEKPGKVYYAYHSRLGWEGEANINSCQDEFIGKIGSSIVSYKSGNRITYVQFEIEEGNLIKYTKICDNSDDCSLSRRMVAKPRKPIKEITSDMKMICSFKNDYKACIERMLNSKDPIN